ADRREAPRSRARWVDRGGDGARPRDRRGNRGQGSRDRRRPDRDGFRASLATPVAVLQPHRRLRAAPGAVRGDGDRLPAGRPRGGGSALVTHWATLTA